MLLSAILLSSLSFGLVVAQGTPSTLGSTGTTGTTGSIKASTSNSAVSPENNIRANITSGQIKVHVVKVGLNGALKFEPNKLQTALGDMVQFQFASGNHTVVQSTFEKPCVPISMVNTSVTGFYSGYMPVAAASEMLPVYTVQVTDTKPIWIFCSQGQHCQKGMNMVINENPKANATRTLENYSASAVNSVTVQMKEQGAPGAGTPSRPSAGISPSSSTGTPRSNATIGAPGGAASSSPQTTDRLPNAPGASSNSSSPGSSQSDNPSGQTASSSTKNTASIFISASVGFLAFALVV